MIPKTIDNILNDIDTESLDTIPLVEDTDEIVDYEDEEIDSDDEDSDSSFNRRWYGE